jgi:hypothetical protein
MQFTFEMPPERGKELIKLQRDMNLEDVKDVLNAALTLLEWAVGEAKKGNEVASVNEMGGSYTVLVAPWLLGTLKQ